MAGSARLMAIIRGEIVGAKITGINGTETTIIITRVGDRGINSGWNRWSDNHGHHIRPSANKGPYFVCDYKFISGPNENDEGNNRLDYNHFHSNEQYNNRKNEANNLPVKKSSKEMSLLIRR
ncbi:hypothetical protein LOAG_03668 [Loa loa]|uniref:Uncharacterized protein n=1 Tax=Loa loa TaxID=7209 RepID=A0A1S0U3T1_LOALO|nr:hypothetical protein LOAG_03668 [Loa loa]EFO24824.1 hypothetical protein LOAG_03668 [Loa loa]